MAQEGVTMDRLTEWIGEGEDRHAIPRMDLRKNGHQACCNKLAEYEDLEETGKCGSKRRSSYLEDKAAVG